MIRIIPKLEIKGPNLVKGIHLEGLRVVGNPRDYAASYYLDGADELLYIDVVASLYGRNNLLDIISETAKNIFIPLTVGGGIRSINDINNILRAGADKVAINTAAINRPDLIKEAANRFGSQCVVISIEAKRREGGGYEAYTDNGRERTGVDVFDWAKKAVDLGAGEILVTSIDREGTGKGMDVDLISKISESVPVPVIACGGAGSKEHFLEAINKGKADAVCAASVFHYHQLYSKDMDVECKKEGNIEFLSRDQRVRKFLPSTIQPMDIRELKSFLTEEGVCCRVLFKQKQESEVKHDA
ncbi:MAG: imidazole glycerol phosphate synthase cyclase subunit [Candidatus Omnitrophota bacterium]